MIDLTPSSFSVRFVTLVLLGVAGSWGCAKGTATKTTLGVGGSSSSSSSSSSGVGSTGGGAGTGGTGGSGDAGACVPTSMTPATRFPLDLVFALDQSSADSASWATVSKACSAFFMDSASAGVAAGLVLFPYAAYDCNLNHYKAPTAPVGVLPANAAALVAALPSSAIGVSRPVYPALEGALLQATALKDANPSHAVHVILATSGDDDTCGQSNDDLAALAASALSYNGVLTHVLALPGATVALVNVIAASGGTAAATDLTASVIPFAATLDSIRAAGLGCAYTLPKPPNNQPLDPSEVNLSYTPKGKGAPIVLLRAENLAGCNGSPGWYFDDPKTPTKIELCPQSCATVQADTSAEIDILFGCPSQTN